MKCRNRECDRDTTWDEGDDDSLYPPGVDGYCGKCSEPVLAFGPDDELYFVADLGDELVEGAEVSRGDQCPSCGSWVPDTRAAVAPGQDPPLVEAEYRLRQIGSRWYVRCDCGALYPVTEAPSRLVVF